LRIAFPRPWNLRSVGVCLADEVLTLLQVAKTRGGSDLSGPGHLTATARYSRMCASLKYRGPTDKDRFTGPIRRSSAETA
jgi:hypothetical protein